MHYLAFFWGRAAAARSQSLCNFLSSPLSFRNEDSYGGEATWLFSHVTGFLEYTRPPKHMRGKKTDVEVWVAREILQATDEVLHFFLLFSHFNHDGWGSLDSNLSVYLHICLSLFSFLRTEEFEEMLRNLMSEVLLSRLRTWRPLSPILSKILFSLYNGIAPPLPC
jgi:hypothetical protein